MNGTELLIAIIFCIAFTVAFNMIVRLKAEARFWKDSAFIAMEMYNDKLVKESMGIAIENTFNKKSIELN